MKWFRRIGAILLSLCLLCSESGIVYAMNGKDATGSESEPVITAIEFGEPIIEEVEGDTISIEKELMTYKPFEDATYELTYHISDDGIWITGYEGTVDGQELVIPEEIDGIEVIKISGDAFEDCSGFVGDLIIPKGVTEIGNSL